MPADPPRPPDTFADLVPLIDRLLAGDPAARGLIVARALGRLERLAAKIVRESFPVLRGREDSVVQESALRLLRALGAVTPGTPQEYIGLAVVNVRRVLYDMVADARRAPPPGRPDADTTLDPARLAEWTEFHERVAGLPNDPPDRRRDVVERRLYLGLKNVEVARLLGMTEKQASRAWLAATEQLLDDLPGCESYLREDN